MTKVKVPRNFSLAKIKEMQSAARRAARRNNNGDDDDSDEQNEDEVDDKEGMDETEQQEGTNKEESDDEEIEENEGEEGQEQGQDGTTKEDNKDEQEEEEEQEEEQEHEQKGLSSSPMVASAGRDDETFRGSGGQEKEDKIEEKKIHGRDKETEDDVLSLQSRNNYDDIVGSGDEDTLRARQTASITFQEERKEICKFFYE